MTDDSLLIRSLLDLSEFLEEYGLNSYSQKYLSVANALKVDSKAAHLDEFFDSPYISGGMGTINDLILCAENGNPVSKEDEYEVNNRFRELLEKVKFELKYRKNRMTSDEQ